MTEAEIFGWLRGDTPNVQGQEYALTKREVIIGRGTQSDVQLSDPKISRRHARVRFGDQNVLLEDLGSAHGTLVNGERGEFFVLKDGDVIAMGDTLMVYKASPDTTATIARPDVAMAVPPPAGQAAAPGIATDQSPPPPAAKTEDRQGTKMFMFGLIPVLLVGMVLIAAFIILAGEPEPYEAPDFPEQSAAALPGEAQGTAIEPTAQPTSQRVETDGAITTTPTNGVPAIRIRPRNLDGDDNVLPLSEVSSFNETESGGDRVIYDGEVVLGREYGFGWYQCAVDEETLQDNLNYFTVDFTAGEDVFGLDDLTLSEMDRGDEHCYFYDGVLSVESVGSFELLLRYTQSEAYSDGFETHPPGTLETLFRIEVVDAEEQSAEAREEPRVTLHIGDARFFSVPPEALAYANTQYVDPPAEIAISEDCGGSGCWRYNEWLAMGEAGQYVEIESTVSTTAIGVQLWGDANDGWARVIVDGQEVWTGEMRGSDNQWPGGAFVRYLEVAGLEPGNHTLRFEPADQGGPVTVYFFGLGEVDP